jgi:hypothetical protein
VTLGSNEFDWKHDFLLYAVYDLFSNYFAYCDFRQQQVQLENLAVASIVSPQPEQVLKENNDDVVSFGNLGCALLTTIPLPVSCAPQIDHYI